MFKDLFFLNIFLIQFHQNFTSMLRIKRRKLLIKQDLKLTVIKEKNKTSFMLCRGCFIYQPNPSDLITTSTYILMDSF